jgi:hypothetical protein
MSWENFVRAVCNRFDRYEHNHLLRQFFHIKQTTNISEYVEQFSDIVHQLLAHDPSFAPTVIANCFVDGLKRDIRAVVMMHRPQDLDTATSLAFLQEETIQDNPVRRPELGSYPRKTSQDSTKTQTQDSNKPSEDKKTIDGVKSKHGDNNLSALKSYRRAKGFVLNVVKSGDHNTNALLRSLSML